MLYKEGDRFKVRWRGDEHDVLDTKPDRVIPIALADAPRVNAKLDESGNRKYFVVYQGKSHPLMFLIQGRVYVFEDKEAYGYCLFLALLQDNCPSQIKDVHELRQAIAECLEEGHPLYRRVGHALWGLWKRLECGPDYMEHSTMTTEMLVKNMEAMKSRLQIRDQALASQDYGCLDDCVVYSVANGSSVHVLQDFKEGGLGDIYKTEELIETSREHFLKLGIDPGLPTIAQRESPKRVILFHHKSGAPTESYSLLDRNGTNHYGSLILADGPDKVYIDRPVYLGGGKYGIYKGDGKFDYLLPAKPPKPTSMDSRGSDKEQQPSVANKGDNRSNQGSSIKRRRF